MAYLTQSEIETAIPPQDLVNALDDDGDGAADSGLLTNIISKASVAVDGFLGSLYTVPFTDPAPAAVRDAAFVFGCELIYARRERGGAANPFTKRADEWRERLGKIGAGDLPLDAGSTAVFTPGDAVTEAVKVDGGTG